MSLDISLYVDVDTGGQEPYRLQLADKNITHNVSDMWRLVGCYEALYESDGKTAGELLPVLDAAVEQMRLRIEECRRLNPPNGWGNADSAYAWLVEWRDACRAHPKATIAVWA